MLVKYLYHISTFRMSSSEEAEGLVAVEIDPKDGTVILKVSTKKQATREVVNISTTDNLAFDKNVTPEKPKQQVVCVNSTTGSTVVLQKPIPSGAKKRKQKDDMITFDSAKKAYCGKKTLLTCEICDQSFASPVTLKAHMNRHHTTLLICKVCRVTFKTKEQKEAHEETCQKVSLSDTFSGMCPVCQKMFMYQHALRNHMTTEHKSMVESRSINQTAPHTCTQCNPEKSFANETLLSKHMFWAHSKNKIKILNRNRKTEVEEKIPEKPNKSTVYLSINEQPDETNVPKILAVDEVITEKLIPETSDTDKAQTKNVPTITPTDIFHDLDDYSRNMIQNQLDEIRKACNNKLSHGNLPHDVSLYSIYCCKCNACISIMEYFNEHIRDCVPNDLKCCSLCGRTFRGDAGTLKTILQYLQHMQTHTRFNSMTSCRFCDNVFINTQNYTVHLANLHTITKTPTAQQNDESLELKTKLLELQNHFKRISPNVDVNINARCTNCNLECSLSTYINEHLEHCLTIHKSMKCIFCHLFKFSNGTLDERLSFIQHISSHIVATKEIPIQKCVSCDNRWFLNSTNLSYHRQYAHRTSRENLRCKINAVWYKFKCPACDFRFPDRTQMIKHILEKHGPAKLIDKHNCLVCQFIAVTKWELQCHIVDEHSSLLPKGFRFEPPEQLEQILG
ncbi:hypothetical protein B566_EDAN013300 [Ephemera danica]|nr:hypothetical protein B566_EDAN013300 [Ephemera danica]